MCLFAPVFVDWSLVVGVVCFARVCMVVWLFACLFVCSFNCWEFVCGRRCSSVVVCMLSCLCCCAFAVPCLLLLCVCRRVPVV